jgi:hypothetical protein
MGVKQYAEKGDSMAHIELCRDISSLNDIVVFPFYKMAITVRDDIESTPSRHLALTMTLAWAKVVLSGEGRNQNKDISRRLLEIHHPKATQYSDTPGTLVSIIIKDRPLGRAMYGRMQQASPNCRRNLYGDITSSVGFAFLRSHHNTGSNTRVKQDLPERGLVNFASARLYTFGVIPDNKSVVWEATDEFSLYHGSIFPIASARKG